MSRVWVYKGLYCKAVPSMSNFLLTWMYDGIVRKENLVAVGIFREYDSKCDPEHIAHISITSSHSKDVANGRSIRRMLQLVRGSKIETVTKGSINEG